MCVRRRFFENPPSIIFLGSPIGGAFTFAYIGITSSSHYDSSMLRSAVGYTMASIFFGYVGGFIPAVMTAGIANAMRRLPNRALSYLATASLAGPVSWLSMAVMEGGSRGSGGGTLTAYLFSRGYFPH